MACLLLGLTAAIFVSQRQYSSHGLGLAELSYDPPLPGSLSFGGFCFLFMESLTSSEIILSPTIVSSESSLYRWWNAECRRLRQPNNTPRVIIRGVSWNNLLTSGMNLAHRNSEKDSSKHLFLFWPSYKRGSIILESRAGISRKGLKQEQKWERLRRCRLPNFYS